MKILGYCKECMAPIHESDEMLPDYPMIFQCPNCSYPNAPTDMWYNTEKQSNEMMIKWREKIRNWDC